MSNGNALRKEGVVSHMVTRLEEAFETLNNNGVRALHNFMCCTNCACAAMGEELREGDHGWVFYHEQDTESAASGSLYLGYGAASDDASNEEIETIGHEIIAALDAANLAWEWNGSSFKKIEVFL